MSRSSAAGGVLLLLALGIPVLDAAAAPGHTEGLTFAQIAQPVGRSAGAPRASDVCFSTRWPRAASEKEPHDSFQAARAFHATRLDWLYLRGHPSDKEFMARAKALGYLVGGTLNSNLHDSPTLKTYTVGRTVNLNGEPLKDRWTATWGARFGCPNSPDYARVYLEHARYALDAGVDQFQMDGPQFNDIMVNYGGCFCEHCLQGFRKHLAAHSTAAQRTEWGIQDFATFDYAAFLRDLGTPPDVGIATWKGPREVRDLFREFQVDSGVRFLGEMHEQIDGMAGRKLTYSCNATREFLSTYHKVHDFALIETYPGREGNPAFLYNNLLRKAQELRKSYLLTFVSDDVAHNRRFIASAYALGANVVVPWDVFTGFTSPRFFGTPEQFADLYGFVRANASLLDGYEEAAVVGPAIGDLRYKEDRPPLQAYASSPVLAVIRARPGEPDAPVVVHLAAATVAKTGPIRLTLDAGRFFGERPLKMRFLAPPPYDPAAHDKAEASRDFAPLSRAVDLPGGRVCVVDLPAVDPWGILVVEPAGEKVTAPWQPAVWCDERSRAGQSLEVRLGCATPGAQIRYTLDGSTPTKAATAYEKPILLETSATVKAIAFAADGTAGPPVTARFKGDEGLPRLTPDAPELRDALRLWLRADALAATHQDGAPVKEWPAVVGPGAAVATATLLDGKHAGPPTFGATLFNGHPAVRFDGADDLLVVPGFANAFLAGKPFTVFLVTQSEDDQFGIAGNAASGSGGIPRLYLTRHAFTYDRLTDFLTVGAMPGPAAVTVYRHDGANTATAFCDGRVAATRDDLPVAKEFGSGGNLAMPFWSGSANHAGDIAEVIVYDRALTDAQIEAVEEDIAIRYGTGTRLRWR